MAFQATIPKHQELRKILICVPHCLSFFVLNTFVQAASYGQWLDLDRLLVQFWESHSTCPEVICTTQEGERQNTRDFVEFLLPELTRRGMVDLTE